MVPPGTDIHTSEPAQFDASAGPTCQLSRRIFSKSDLPQLVAPFPRTD